MTLYRIGVVLPALCVLLIGGVVIVPTAHATDLSAGPSAADFERPEMVPEIDRLRELGIYLQAETQKKDLVISDLRAWIRRLEKQAEGLKQQVQLLEKAAAARKLAP